MSAVWAGAGGGAAGGFFGCAMAGDAKRERAERRHAEARRHAALSGRRNSAAARTIAAAIARGSRHSQSPSATKSAPAFTSGAISSMRSGIGDARYFEHLRPPGDALFDRLQARPFAGGVRLAEHHIVGASLRGEHGVVAGDQAADADDAVRLEAFDRFVE